MLPTLRPGYFVIVNKLAYLWSQPNRGDVIVFRQPQDSSQRYIKRTIGLPGDTVRIGGGEVYINGALLHEPYLQVRTDRDGTWEVPENEYFVMGDNRRNSSDSRSWGFVVSENVIGRALLVYWPPAQWGMIEGKAFATAEY
jgi:signal peptidase I